GAPATVNEDAAGAGWFLKLKVTNPAEVDQLMDGAAYQAYLATLA
ncbi:MAG: glycine cleavage system protein H, partial [Rhizobiales bacterium 32-66-8]